MSDPWSRRRDGLALLALVALGVLLPLAVGVVAGSLDIPRNDDWSFRSIALHLFRTGHLELNGAAAMLLVGQIFLVQPYLWVSDGSSWAFWAAGTTFDAIAIVSAYMLARSLLPRERSVIVVALLPLFPGFLAYATSFMTDVPAMALSFVSLWMGMVALGRRLVSLRWLFGALIVGCIAFSIRESALAAPVSVIAAAILSEPRRLRYWLTAIVLLAICVGIAYGRSQLSGLLVDPLPHLGPIPRIRASLISVAFVLLPAAALGAVRWRRHWRLGDVTVGAALGSFVVAFWAYEAVRFGPVQAILDNLTSQSGVPAPDYLSGGRPLLFSDAIWAAINVIALIATIVVPAVAAGILGNWLRRDSMRPLMVLRRLGSPAGMLLLFSVATASGIIWLGLRWSVYDRYLWVLIPPLATLLMYLPADLREPVRIDAEPVASASRWTGSIPRLVVVGGPLIILTGMSLMYLLNSHAFDIARWRAGQALVAEGVPAESIDAGYEWMGTYAPGVAQFAERPMGGTGLTWYSGLWPEFRLCAFVSSGPVSVSEADLVGVDQAAYLQLLIMGPETALNSYRIRTGDCGSE